MSTALVTLSPVTASYWVKPGSESPSQKSSH